MKIAEFKKLGGTLEIGGPDGFGRYNGTADAPQGFVFGSTMTHFVAVDDCDKRAGVTAFLAADLAMGLVKCTETGCEVCGKET